MKTLLIIGLGLLLGLIIGELCYIAIWFIETVTLWKLASLSWLGFRFSGIAGALVGAILLLAVNSEKSILS